MSSDNRTKIVYVLCDSIGNANQHPYIHLEQTITKQLQNVDVQNKAIIVCCFHLNAHSSENFVRPNQVNFILEAGHWTSARAATKQ